MGTGCGIMEAMEPYIFQATLARRLLAWGLASMAGGAALALAGHAGGSSFLRALGSQTIGWGAIDAGLAVAGRARAARLAADPPDDPEARAREAIRTRRLLAVNAGLDVAYVATGLGVAAGPGRRDPAACGHGLATIVQGAFLLVFDVVHATRVPEPSGPSSGIAGRWPAAAREA